MRGFDSEKSHAKEAPRKERQGVNPRGYLKHVLTELPARPPDADLTDLLPDAWARSRAGLVAIPA